MIDQQMDFGNGASAGLIRDLRVATTREMEAAGSTLVVALFDGRCLSSSGSRTVWSFAVEVGVADQLQPDTPAHLTHSSGRTAEARVLAVGDESVVLGLPLDFGEGEGWVLQSDARFIFERLLERLDELGAGDRDEELLTDLLYPDAFTVDEDEGSGDSEPPASPDEEQQRAARQAIEPGIRFTWGPPGTGKTRVLGMAVSQAAMEDRRVLVLAHANVAVDVALERIAEELGADHPLVAGGKVIRVGIPQAAGIAARHDLLPEHIAQSADPTGSSRVDALRKELRELSARARTGTESIPVAERIEVVRGELRSANSLLAERARLVVEDASVVATTLTRSVIDETIWSSHFDLVVIDEASMAPLPIVLALVMRGARTVSFFGDFRQLPPVAISDDEIAREFFATDVFKFAEVIQMHEQGLVDPRLSVLRTQFRMGESICAVVNDLAYDGLLRTAPTARNTAIRSAERGIAPGDELVIVDTSGIGARCDGEAAVDKWSRYNLSHAMLVASLAQSLEADGFNSVGVISPYRAQIELLTSLLRDHDSIQTATIHKFQGSECDAVVLDLTDALPMSGPSRLTGGESDMALRLFNVAVSRARHKLVVVADCSFVEKRMPLGSVP
ncbi:MAG: AAA domain-containing protein, partial [Microthrixaceae bacterium]